MKTFKSLLEFQKNFNTEGKCREFLELQRWGVHTNVCRFTTNKKVFKCREKECRKKFSVTVGTIYENSKLPLTKAFLNHIALSIPFRLLIKRFLSFVAACTM